MPKERGAVTIYALLAELKNGPAAYIGQAVDFERRMREHCKMREGKAATLLIKQAQAEGRSVLALILETVNGAEEADTAEGAWIWKAQEKGVNLIALDNWFQRKNSSRHLAPSKAWPDSAAIALHAMPLHEFSKAAIEREKARKKFMDELDD